jgi:phage gpG-like protein
MHVEGVQKLQLDLNSLVKRSDNLTVPLKQGRVLMLRSINQNFHKSGRPILWTPLSLAYAKQKKRQGYGNKILVRTGQLKRSISGSVQPKKLTIGTAVHYGKYHQFGTSKMPMRKFLLFQDEDLKRISTLVREYLLDKRG